MLLIGTNDLTAQAAPDEIATSIEQMIRMAREQQVDVVLCSLLPVGRRFAPSRPPDTIIEVNKRLSALAERHHIAYVDFHTALSGDDGLIREAFTSDGLHASEAGYAVMTGILHPILMKHLIGQSPIAR